MCICVYECITAVPSVCVARLALKQTLGVKRSSCDRIPQSFRTLSPQYSSTVAAEYLPKLKVLEVEVSRLQ